MAGHYWRTCQAWVLGVRWSLRVWHCCATSVAYFNFTNLPSSPVPTILQRARHTLAARRLPKLVQYHAMQTAYAVDHLQKQAEKITNLTHLGLN